MGFATAGFVEYVNRFEYGFMSQYLVYLPVLFLAVTSVMLLMSRTGGCVCCPWQCNIWLLFGWWL